MSPRAAPDGLMPWAMSILGLPSEPSMPELAIVAGDASNRRYFRARLGGVSYVLVEAPPATEKNEAFLAVRDLLAAAGVKVPALFGADLVRGFLLLEDLGDELLLPALQSSAVDRYYRSAFKVLEQMALANLHGAGLGSYDRELLGEELGRFSTWFVQALLGYCPDASEEAMLERFFACLIDSALEQPRVLVHRDFHSRNLMLVAADQLAVIDFQDAVTGPVTYDLVSLLRDCYIQWSPGQVRSWALVYLHRMHARGQLTEVDDAVFLRWFDWMGLQRHIKVLGTFARLYLRDGKPAYLDDLPLVLHYVLEIVQQYAAQEPEFEEFGDWFNHKLSPRIAQQEWSRAL